MEWHGFADLFYTILYAYLKFLGMISAITMIMLFFLSDGVRYRLKYLTFMVTSALTTVIAMPVMFLRIRSWKNALFPAKVASICAKLLGIDYCMRGKENIVKDSGCVVLINHQSALDLCVLAELWPVLRRAIVIAKKEVLYLGPFGFASWLWGTIFIDRRNIEESHNVINATANTIRNAKMKLLLFPEGKRYCGTSLMPFKKGAFHLAITSQTPIQPVVVSRYYFLNHKLKIFNSGKSYITILPPIYTEGLTKEDLPKLMEKAYDVMNKAFIESTKEAVDEQINLLKNE